MYHPRYTLPEPPKPQYNPWPDRILMAACFVIISLAGSMLIAGFFGFLD